MSLKNMALASAAAAFLFCAGTSFANVYAAHLTATNTGGNNYNISYRLNENADTGVTVKVKGPLPATTVVRTIAAGSQLKGLNTVAWDGKDDASATVASGSYTFEVTAAASGYPAVTKLTDEGPLPAGNKFLNFYTPYGLAIDKNPASANFGKIYVVNNAGSVAATPATTTDGRTMQDGVYILSNDFQDITGQGDTPYNGGVAWLGTSSPFRVRLDADGVPFICDWSDSHSGVWIMDPANPSAAFSELFDSNIVRESSGLRTGLHGSIAGLYVTGTGSGRVLTTIDEDLDLTAATAGEGKGSLYSYAIGTATSGYNTAPTVTFDDFAAGNLEQNMNSTIAPGNGGWWINQNRSTDSATVPSLIHVATPSQAVDWNSFTNFGGINAGAQGGIDISNDGTKLVYSGSAWLRVYEIGTFPVVTLAYEAGATYTGGTSRDASFDAAGNFYGTNSSSEYLRGYSPAGANSYTTPAPAAVTMAVVAGVNEWLNY